MFIISHMGNKVVEVLFELVRISLHLGTQDLGIKTHWGWRCVKTSLKDTKNTITYILCIFIESNIINSGVITTSKVRKLLEYLTRGCSIPKH